MSWLALWLIGLAAADLAHSVRPVRTLPGLVGATAVLLAALAGDLLRGWAVVAVLLLAGAAFGWDRAVRHGFGARRPALPLALLLTGSLAVLAASPAAPSADGVLGGWLAEAPVGWMARLSGDEALLLLGVLGVQCSTGNVVVRLVLAATDTVNPARGPSHDATRTLKGGRLLGPMERLFIVGLGLAGQVTAAGIVVAAKGLLRWPELQARRDATDGPSIDEVTEYFLVGSFVSWTWALTSLVLVA